MLDGSVMSVDTHGVKVTIIDFTLSRLTKGIGDFVLSRITKGT